MAYTADRKVIKVGGHAGARTILQTGSIRRPTSGSAGGR
jgi:hypothetical protein